MLAIAAEFQPEILEELTGILGEAGLSFKALAADASGCRIFPRDVPAAKAALTEAGYFCQEVQVLHVKVADKAGTFNEVMRRLRTAEVQVLSTFGMGIKDEGAIFVRVDDLDAACKALDD